MKLTISDRMESRNFYRNLYRRFIRWLWLSLLLNVLLAVVLFYYVLNIPEPKYYATNSSGPGFVLSLRALTRPNPSNKTLLKPDPPEEVKVKPVNI